MAIYICDVCDKTLDGDHDPCVEHPIDSTKFCCESCQQEILDEEAKWE